MTTDRARSMPAPEPDDALTTAEHLVGIEPPGEIAGRMEAAFTRLAALVAAVHGALDRPA